MEVWGLEWVDKASRRGKELGFVGTDGVEAASEDLEVAL